MKWPLPFASLAIAVAAHPARADGDASGELEGMRDAFRLGPSMTADAAWWMKARSFVNMDTMPGVAAMFGGAAVAAQPVDWSAPRPGRVAYPEATGVFASPLQPLVDPVRNGLAGLRGAGLRTDIYEAATYSVASDTIGGARPNYAVGRFNARVDALLFRNEGEGMGRVTAQVRQNNFWPERQGDETSATGSSVYLNVLTGVHDTAIARLSYAQSFADDRVIVTAGKINAGDFAALNVFASDEATQYLALMFDGNDVLPFVFQSYTPGVAVQALATDWLYLAGVWGSADGATDALVDAQWTRGSFVAADAEAIFEWLDMPGRVGLTWVGADVGNAEAVDEALPTVWGNAWFACAQYFLRENAGIWAQYSVADEGIAALVQSEFALGATLDDCFGRKGDGFGLAAGWAEPVDPAAQGTQFLVESYYRLQVTGLSQVSLDVQMLAPSASDDASDPTVVGTLRWVVRF